MSDLNDIYRVTPRQAKKFILTCLQAGLVPFVRSSPGMGKSAIVREIAKELNAKMIDHRLSTSAPEDLTGLPRFENGRAEFVPFRELFPLEDDVVPEGKNGWIVFLDEFNSAPKSVQAASYKLILDRQVGQHNVNPNAGFVLAGNLDTDRAIVNKLSTAMQSRVVHIEMDVNFEEWLEDVAIPQKYDSRIIAFLSMTPSKLLDFRPDHADRTFCCPRTWEFVNNILQVEPKVDDEIQLLLSGTITTGTAADFVQFCQLYKERVSLDTILKDPEKAPIPGKTALKYATILDMAEHVDIQNFGPFATYADRLDASFRILFYRSVVGRNPQLAGTEEYITAMSRISKYLKG